MLDESRSLPFCQSPGSMTEGIDIAIPQISYKVLGYELSKHVHF